MGYCHTMFFIITNFRWDFWIVDYKSYLSLFNVYTYHTCISYHLHWVDLCAAHRNFHFQKGKVGNKRPTPKTYLSTSDYVELVVLRNIVAMKIKSHLIGTYIQTVFFSYARHRSSYYKFLAGPNENFQYQ